MRIAVIALISPRVVATDGLSGLDLACDWSIDRMATLSYVCGQTGMCESVFTFFDNVPNVSCDDAVIGMAVAFGARPRQPLPDGLLHQPIIIEHDVWPPTEYGRAILIPVTDADTAAAPAVVRYHLMRLLDDMDRINIELDFWAPRIVYVPSRIRDTLKNAYNHIHALSRLIDRGDVSLGFVSSFIDGSHAIDELGYLVEHHTAMVLGMSELEGFLNALIPFLHLYSELHFAFPLATSTSVGFLVGQPSLVLTLSQYDPMYLGDDFVEWRFRFVNVRGFLWRDYASEKVLLVTGADRIRSFVSCGGNKTEDACLETVVGSLTHAANISVNPLLRMFALGEIIAEILYFLESSTAGEYRSRVHGALNQFLTSNPVLLDELSFSEFSEVRASAVLFTMFKPLFSLEKRLQKALFATSMNANIDEPFFVSPGTAEQMIAALGGSLYEFHAVVDDGRLDAAWMRKFVELVVGPHLKAAEWRVRISSETPRETKRVIGRAIAYSIWTRIHDAGGLLELIERNANVGGTHLEIVFFGDDHVRMGFYDWFRFGGFEQMIDAAEVGDAIRYISRSA
jgi:hypothetical protein